MSKAIQVLLLLFAAAHSSAQQAQQQAEPEFPRTDEIKLVVTQAEAAFEQYKQSVSLEAELPTAKQNKSMLEKDRDLVETSARVIAGLKKNPEAFHGLGGLLLLSSLDDASRNAALCSSSGGTDILEGVLTDADTKSAYQILRIAQGCLDVSVHLYTVSESVHALLVRELEAQQLLNQRAMDMVDKCNALMKTVPEEHH